MLGFVRRIALVLVVAAATVAITIWLMMVRDRRKSSQLFVSAPSGGARSPQAQTAPTPTVVPSPDGDLDWSREEIRMLKGHVGNQTIVALMELLREREGAPVNYQELMLHTGRTMPQVRADLAVFSRAVKKVEGHQQWPIDTASPTDGESKVAYTAPVPYLDWWFEE